MARFDSTSSFKDWQRDLAEAIDPDARMIMVCCGTGCTALGAHGVFEAIEAELKKQGLEGEIQLKRTGCHGFCEQGPLVLILPERSFYPGITPDDVPELIEKAVVGGEVIERLLYTDPATKKKIVYEQDVPFYAKQERIVFRHSGRIDPISLEDYVGRDGYGAMAKALDEHSPEEVVAIVTDAGLRGRGGAGFPAGVKWGFCRNAPGDRKYLICNADEGDPGAFMDRSILEGTPHAVIEGMLIAGYAIGATHGFIYVRAEYPLAVSNTLVALDQAREAGLLGTGILGTDFSFDIEIREGAGAFVCGEETALIASIEGLRGMPRPRPPFPATSGYHGCPTNINNVETLANVPVIVAKGAEWYKSIGTEGSKGTKIFALAGKVKNTGLVEVPMGITLREIVFDIGGGIPGDKQFKAAQMGGPSGGCVPESALDMPVDFDSVKGIGAIMGSGGLIVMDEGTCIVDIAKYFLTFVQSESCGGCVPCRLGTKQMLEILVEISEGRASLSDLDVLGELALNVCKSSLCGLGQTAPNPVLSTLRHFKDEYVAHISENRCPAGVCKELTTFVVDDEKCKACGACVKACPVEAISGGKKKVNARVIDEKCIRCRSCYEACPFDAIAIEGAAAAG